MIAPVRSVQVAACVAALAACSTQTVNGDDSLYIQSYDSRENQGSINILSSLPTSVGNLRIKVNGRFFVYDGLNGQFHYAEIQGGYWLQTAFGRPIGITNIELVNPSGQTVLASQPIEVRLAERTLLWVHDSPAGLMGEVPSLIPDDDPDTVEVSVWSASANPVVAMRCAGRVVCPGCGVSNGISPATCTTLGTVGPGEHWTTKQVPTNAGPPPVDGAACLDVVFEGVAAPLSCGVQLDVGSLGYRQLTYIFVDDVQGWGGAPSVFYDVSSY